MNPMTPENITGKSKYFRPDENLLQHTGNDNEVTGGLDIVP
jgi:hypothetical protein